MIERVIPRPRRLAPGRSVPRAVIALRALLLLAAVAMALSAGASAEQAAQPSSPAAGQIDAGGDHSCALDDGTVSCWGLGFSGQLGYGNTNNIGDDEPPGAAGAVSLGAGRTATAVSAGDSHTCALLDDGTVRCWGFGEDGRLGYGNEATIGDDEAPGSVGPVSLGRPATAITAGGAHSCALLDDGAVRCWGFGEDGQLGYAIPPREDDDDPATNDDPATIGDDETPDSVAPVSLGGPATAISAGGDHTCALLAGGDVRCWGSAGEGFGGEGRLGYGDQVDDDGRNIGADDIGDDETPDSVDPVNLGDGRTATALSAGDRHTCAVLDGGDVRCWGSALTGRLGYMTRQRAVGDNEAPGAFGPVALGSGRTATAVSAGRDHTCARLDGGGDVRCWGLGTAGRLGYANTNTVGDDETPDTAGPVNLGSQRTAAALSAGGSHTCARLDDGAVRCWGDGLYGRLGYCNRNTIGDDETPGEADPCASIDDMTVNEGDSGETAVTFTVKLSTASGDPVGVTYATADDSARAPEDYTAGSGSLPFAPGETSKTVTVQVKGDTLDELDERLFVNLSNAVNVTIPDPQGTATIVDDDASKAPDKAPPLVDREAAALRAQAARLRGLRTCLAKVKRHARGESRRARRLSGPRRKRAKRHARRHESRLRRACLRRWGRTPGRVTGLEARTLSPTKIALTYKAPGSHGSRPPAARGYVVKQSRRPIRGARAFRRARALCDGSCRFPASTRVGSTITLTVTDLRPRTTYYYSVAARDNVSRRPGPRSIQARVRTQRRGGAGAR